MVRHVYQQFGLDGFDNVQPQIEEYWSERRDHRPNRTSLDKPVQDKIDQHWSRYLREFGYQPLSVPASRVG